MIIINVSSTNLLSGERLYGKLTLVDLAGSEKVDKSGVTEERLKEAQAINKSLSALGIIIFSTILTDRKRNCSIAKQRETRSLQRL